MEIINAHVHAIDLKGMITHYPDLKLSSGIASLSHLEQTIPLLDPAILLRQMDEAGIDRSVLLAVEAPVIYASNEYVADLCKKYPDRFIGFASVDPKRDDAMEVLKKAIEGLELKGIKFHPPLQDFYPNDERYFYIYQAARDWGIPVVFHVGSTPFGNLCKLSQANPLLIDDIAVAFPELRIMLTHLGTLWQNEAFMVVEKNPNVFIDTAAYLYEIGDILTENLISRIGEDKIIFGTDYPMPSPPHAVHNMKAFVEKVKQLPLPSETKEKIFSKNFKKMIGPPICELKESLKLKDMIEYK
jgi:predicted TIM-barrel fold metal-dependent hydrolase